MIQTVALLVTGAAAAGLWLTDRFPLHVACWVLGTVLHAGLVAASSSSIRGRQEVRQVFLLEMMGAWVLLMAGLHLVIATGATDLRNPGAAAAPAAALHWVGAGLLLVTGARLGLPPVGPWQVRLTSAPPAVRVFLHAGLHPATALVLWSRLDVWLLPWHRSTAVWLGVVAALAAMLAAVSERLAPRRAAVLGAGTWCGLFALTAATGVLSVAAFSCAVLGVVSLQLVATLPRWPRAARRVMLACGGSSLLATGWFAMRAAAPLEVPGVPLALALVAASLAVALVVLGHWWWALPRSTAAANPPQRPLWNGLSWLAARSREAGPVPALARRVADDLAGAVAVVDRLVLDGVAEGLAIIGTGAGWCVAWVDRRGCDAVEHGLAGLVTGVGRAARTVVTVSPARLIWWLMALVLGLALLGRWRG